MTGGAQCVEDEALAAFLEGRLLDSELRSTVAHMRTCAACRWRLTMTAFASHELALGSQPEIQPAIQPLRQGRWWPSAAVAAALAVAVSLGVVRWMSGNEPMDTLVASAPRDFRDLEPRISGGFEWAALRPVQRSAEPSPLDADRMKFMGAAGSVLEETDGDTSVDAQHAAAVAYLVSQRAGEASARLQKLATQTNDAGVWSDLGAALYVEAVVRAGAGRLAEALAATDMALRLDPRQPDALFNRALILERLGTDDEARAAWERYLAVDPEGGWANEARRRLQELTPASGLRNQPGADQQNRFWDPKNEGDKDLPTELRAAAESAARNGSWVASLSLLNLENNLPRGSNDDFRRAEANLMVARLRLRMGDAIAATADAKSASSYIGRIPNAARQARAKADYLAVTGILAASPSDRAHQLTSAIAFHTANGLHESLPEAYLQRGRALTALGRLEQAGADYESGIREMERLRVLTQTCTTNNAAPPAARWDTAFVREELFEEAVALAVSRGDPARAFAYAERERESALVRPLVAAGVPAVVGTLWDTRDPTATVSAKATAPDHVIVEYAAMPSYLVTFVVRNGEVRVATTEVRRDVLAEEIKRLVASVTVRDDETFRRAATALYGWLLAPVASDIASAHTLVIVPDATLAGVPFSALRAPDGRYVVERHAVVTTPSASAFRRLSARPRSTSAPRKLLVIAGAWGNRDGGRLFAAEREAQSVAAVYDGLDRMVRVAKGYDRADIGSFADADVIHFIGHAVAANGAAEGALTTFKEDGTIGYVGASEIAATTLMHTRAVILAACSTARGGEPSGGGRSVAQAFLDAGVPSVVATIWPIEDAPAAEFFPRFHQYLARGYSPPDALRATQLEWIRKRGTPPATWAAFQVVGS